MALSQGEKDFTGSGFLVVLNKSGELAAAPGGGKKGVDLSFPRTKQKWSNRND